MSLTYTTAAERYDLAGRVTVEIYVSLQDLGGGRRGPHPT